MTYYAGIGSRETPQHILDIFTRVATYLSDKQYTLRSGGAGGADTAFEIGAEHKDIYIPWKGFNGSTSDLYNIPVQAFEMAEKYHPAWNRLSQGARKLMARNCQQVLGQNLDTPVSFIICYTPGGTGGGGTGQALRIAKDYNIPICDLGKFPKQADRYLAEFLKRHGVRD